MIMALCGAKNRSGEPCKKHVLKGSSRCKLHGGKSTGAPKGNQNRNTHGIYSSVINDEEKAIWDQVQIGRIDDELKLCRIRLVRALAAENKDGNDLLLESKVEKTATAASVPLDDSDVLVDKSYKRRDYSGIIDRLLARIESLEKTRIELMKAGGDGIPAAKEDARPVGKILVEVVHARN
jgi:hypothetical protein